MAIHYLRHVFGPNFRVPDVIGVDKDDGALLVAAGAGITEYGGRRYPAPIYLFLEGRQQLTAALRAAASFAGGGAHEDVA